MEFFQKKYRYLLVTGFLSFCLAYLCFKRVVKFILRWSTVALCPEHLELQSKKVKQPRVVPDDRSRSKKCEACEHKKQQMSVEISEKCVGILNATNCTVFSFWIIQETKHDVMSAKSPVLIPFVQFSVTYFLYDILAMYASFSSREYARNLSFLIKFWKYLKKRHAFIIHHIILIALGYPLAVNYNLRNGTGDFFIACFCIGDFANHFINGSFILRVLKYENSAIFKINAVLLVLSFLTSRILILPYMYAQYFQQAESPWTESLMRMPKICHLGMALIAVFQVFWASTIIRTGLKLAKPDKLKQS